MVRLLRSSRKQKSVQLPADLLALVGQQSMHWAGHVNVLIGETAVERHLAQALRIPPGKINLAMFCLGSGPEKYKFELSSCVAKWNAALYDMLNS